MGEREGFGCQSLWERKRDREFEQQQKKKRDFLGKVKIAERLSKFKEENFL